MANPVEHSFGEPSFGDQSFGKRTIAPVGAVDAGLSGRNARPRPDNALRRCLARPVERNRLAGLDLLRLAAAFAVILFHYGYAGPTRGFMDTQFPAIAGVAQYGFLGVDLFFLISGFVIAASAFGRSWQQFAVSRFLRLYPGHLACMTATALILAALGLVHAPVSFKQWLANLTMFAPALGQPFMDGAYWSIVIELVFYGWVAALVAAGVFERRLLSILTVWLLIAAINETMFQVRALRIGLLTEYASMFASGILIYRLRAGERSLHAWLLLGAAIGLCLLHGFEAQRVSLRLYNEPLDLPTVWLAYGLIYAVFIGGLAASRRLPSSQPILALGGLTYPLYLIHQQAGYVLIDTLAPLTGAWGAFGIVLAAALGFAFLVWRWVEPAGRTVLKFAIDRAAPLSGRGADTVQALPGLRRPVGS